MTMKRGLIAGVLMMVSAVALAQSPTPGASAPRSHIDRLEILLDLDAYQKQEVEKILEAQRADLRAKREQARESNVRPSREQRMAERAAEQQATREKLAKILSDQQLKKFDVLNERPAMRHGKRGDRVPKQQ